MINVWKSIDIFNHFNSKEIIYFQENLDIKTFEKQIVALEVFIVNEIKTETDHAVNFFLINDTTEIFTAQVQKTQFDKKVSLPGLRVLLIGQVANFGTQNYHILNSWISHYNLRFSVADFKNQAPYFGQIYSIPPQLLKQLKAGTYQNFDLQEWISNFDYFYHGEGLLDDF